MNINPAHFPRLPSVGNKRSAAAGPCLIRFGQTFFARALALRRQLDFKAAIISLPATKREREWLERKEKRRKTRAGEEAFDPNQSALVGSPSCPNEKLLLFLLPSVYRQRFICGG